MKASQSNKYTIPPPMERIIPHVTNETARLRTVVLGLPDSLGSVPSLSETYDAKSYEAKKMCAMR